MTKLDHEQDGNLRVAIATWIFLLSTQDVRIADPEVAELCAAVLGADGPEAGDAAGLALIEHIASMVEQAGTEPEQVVALATQILGEGLATDMGQGDRDARLTRIRGYQFRRGLPWLARIWERHIDGQVAPSWILISEVTDLVRALDPNPWNDVDEDRALPVADFQILWELDTCTSLHVA
ncbi:MAG: hypothetical protein EA397_19505 [Deltaproteobacteria bacterium]|nr:MAG: hypothetical protein EA397_19505 [Deltaproteobacteria bacterium]